jgi:hypothetical protein
MKNLVLTCMATTFAASLCTAAPADDVKAAAKKLAEAANYSWTSRAELANVQFTPPTIEGKTEKGGYTLLTQRRDDNVTEAVLKGSKGVLKTDEGWKTADELGQPGGGPGRGGMMGRMLLTTKPPAEDVESLLAKVKDLKAAEGVISGVLTEDGAKELLRFRRGPRAGQPEPPAPKNAKGSVKFWIKDGALTKYEVKVQGTITFGQDQQERDMDRTTTVEIKDVGTTKVQVPDDAKKKLGA